MARIAEVRESMEQTAKGDTLQTKQNCVLALREDPLFGGAIRLNLLTGQKVILKDLGWKRLAGPITDEDLSQIYYYLEKFYGLKSEKNILHAINIVSAENSFHPIIDHLNTLVWDGQERIRYVLNHFLGAEVCELNFEAMKVFLCGALERVFKPGCKFEIMLCLVGSQGAGKSTFFRFLAMNDSWFTDDLRNLSDAKVYEKLVGHWIIEMAEMIGTSSAKSVEEIKAFLSRLVDNYRDPYGKFPKDRPRQCVFVGTTNTQRFLPLDRTGNRRFFPIPTGITKPEVHILDDEKASRAYIEQLWAEAMVIYRSGNYSLCLSPEMDKEMNIRRVDFMAEDTTTGMIQSWLDEYKGNYVCTYLIYNECYQKLHDIDLNAPKDEQPRVDRRTREVEAESVAYTVCQHYGLDTSDYSFGYVAGWSSGRELSELKSSLETIRSAAAEIINSIDENLAELQKAQDKEQTAGQEQTTREGQEAAPQPEAPAKADTAGKEQPEAAAPGKSGAQEKAGAAPKEAFTPETIYRVRRNPYSDSRENSHLLQAYVTQENGRAKMGDVLYTGTPEKCRELMGQLKGGELTEGDVKQLYAKAQETAQTAGQDKDTFSIYQIKGGDETRDFRFEPYDRLQAAGNVVDRANYELVYTAPLAPETSLEDIYTRFNIDHPKDFRGHSLSVSDVVVLHQNGQDAAHFVDSVGFRQVPEFLQEQKQLTPDDLETGETIKTPRGTFHVTAMSREQIETAGYGFHHQSDDGKYLIMGNGTRAFAVAAEQPEKENPLKYVEDTVEQNDNSFDGIINNTPTVDELEAKVKAGETISLVDLANAVKADRERGKEAKPEKKPSIRAQLRADKEKAQKKNAKQKSQDLERS